MNKEGRFDYIEIPVTDLQKARDFFAGLFDWTFQEWGPEYISFNDGRLEGGLRRSDVSAPATGILLVFYSEDLERDVGRVEELGATISKKIFDFPGGRRFHFVDPVGTEFAMWSEMEQSEQ